METFDIISDHFANEISSVNTAVQRVFAHLADAAFSFSL